MVKASSALDMMGVENGVFRFFDTNYKSYHGNSGRARDLLKSLKKLQISLADQNIRFALIESCRNLVVSDANKSTIQRVHIRYGLTSTDMNAGETYAT